MPEGASALMQLPHPGIDQMAQDIFSSSLDITKRMQVIIGSVKLIVILVV